MMRNLSIPAMCCIAFLLIQCTPPQAPAVDTAAEAEAVRAADKAWSDASASLDGHMGYILDDAVVLPPNEPMVSGKGNIEKSMAAMFEMPGFTVSWTPTSAEVAGSGDLGYSIGTYSISMNDTTGQAMTDKGKYLTVWKKQADGAWKVAADMFSSDLPLQ